MAHINSLTSGIYTSLAFNDTPGAIGTMDTQAELVALFATAPTRVPGIREFPEFGNPANIVNVPVYGQKSSLQVSGQADQSTMEFTINYVPSEMEDLVGLVNDGNLYAFQIAMCNIKPVNLLQTATTGIGSTGVQNTVFNFAGKFESFVVVPSLTDSYTARITISLATELFGPVTYA
jgi:hypothetical protein